MCVFIFGQLGFDLHTNDNYPSQLSYKKIHAADLEMAPAPANKLIPLLRWMDGERRKARGTILTRGSKPDPHFHMWEYAARATNWSKRDWKQGTRQEQRMYRSVTDDRLLPHRTSSMDPSLADRLLPRYEVHMLLLYSYFVLLLISFSIMRCA
jgi:hypothetical protein